MTTITWDTHKTWRQFRLEAEAAKHYHMPYAMYIGQTHRDVLLERMLPALLYLKAVAILDDAMELWLDTNGHKLSRPYRNDLHGRISYLVDNNLLASAAQLHQVRDRRNTIAHESQAVCDWATLDRDMAVIESSLVALGLARATPKLDFFFERSGLEESKEPGVQFCRTFTYGVKEGGKPALEVSWTQKFLEDD